MNSDPSGDIGCAIVWGTAEGDPAGSASQVEVGERHVAPVNNDVAWANVAVHQPDLVKLRQTIAEISQPL